MKQRLLVQRMLRPLLIIGMAAVWISCSGDHNGNGPTAQTQAIDAAGGAASLQGLNAFTVSATGERWVFDEGFTPGDPPGSAGTFDLEMTYDVAGGRIRLDYVRNSFGLTRNVTEVIAGDVGFIDGEDVNFSPPVTRAMTPDRWGSTVRLQRLLNPQLILIDILQNPGLVIGSSADQLLVDDEINPMTLDLDPATGLITRLSTEELDYIRRDVPVEVNYSDWQQFDGVFFPMTVEIRLDGQRYHLETRTAVTVNPAIAAGLFDFPAGITPTTDPVLADRGQRTAQYLQSFAAFGFIKDGAHEVVNFTQIVPGVFHLPDPSNNSMVVEQANGIVVVEGVLNELRAEAIMNWIAGRFPAKPITHVISTHHHVDHAGGLRSYVAEGVAVVVHEAAEAFYADFLSRTNTTQLPDALDANPVAANILTVPATGSFTIPDAQRPVSVYPVASTEAVDLVTIAVEIPGSTTLFVSDIYTPGAAAGPGAVDFNTAVINAGIDTTGATIAGGHGGTILYSDFVALLPP